MQILTNGRHGKLWLTFLLFAIISSSFVQIALANDPVTETYYIGNNTNLYGDDGCTGAIPIGFTFNYYGSDYTQVYISTNGTVMFLGADDDYHDADIPSASGPNGFLAVFWDDLKSYDTSQPILYKTLGDAGSRKFIIQWTNYGYFNSTLPMGQFQAILHEGTNVIQFQYRQLLTANRSLGQSASVGIENQAGTAGVKYLYHSAGLQDWQAISFTPNGPGYDMDGGATYDGVLLGSGENPPPGIPQLTAPADGATTPLKPTFTWETAAYATSYRLIVSTASNLNSPVVDQSGITDTSFTLTSNLSLSTTYYWALVSINSSGNTFSAVRTFITSDHSSWTITASAGEGGSISPSGAIEVADGGDQAFTITPDKDWHVVDITVDSASVGAVTSYSFNAVGANHTIAATFVQDTGSVQVTIEPAEAVAAGARWRIYGQSGWRESGSVASGVPVGDYAIEFLAIDGWSKADSLFFSCNANMTANLNATYTRLNQKGTLTVTITPAEAAAAGVSWRPVGADAWFASGASALVPAGACTVEFRGTDLWGAPASREVNVPAEASTAITAQAASLAKTLPLIHYFTANPKVVGSGNPTTLQWYVENVDTVAIDGVGAGLEPVGSAVVTIDSSITFTLTAENANGERSARLEVPVMEKPHVNWFFSDAGADNAVFAGRTVTLTWNAQGADSASLDLSDVGVAAQAVVAGNGSYSFIPNRDGVCTLTVTNAVGQESATLPLTISHLPEIVSFSADTAAQLPQAANKLRWKVTGAQNVSIAPLAGPFDAAAGAVNIAPEATTNYELVATNAAGSVRQTLEVHVVEEADAADLTLRNVALPTATAGGWLSGDVVPVTVTVANDGAGKAKSFYLRLSDNGVVCDELYIDRLAAGGERSRSLLWRAGAVGKHTLAISVDPDGAVADTNRKNNSRTLEADVHQRSGIDLTVTAVHVSRVGADAPGGAIVIRFDIVNIGDENAGAFQYRAWLGAKSGTSFEKRAALVAEANADSLKAGASLTVEAEVLVPEKLFKTFFLRIGIDTLQAISETLESNNSAEWKMRGKRID